MLQVGETIEPDFRRLLPPAATLDPVAYACTSGTTLIGAGHVTALMGGACRTGAVTDPLTAAVAAMRALGAARVAVWPEAPGRLFALRDPSLGP